MKAGRTREREREGYLPVGEPSGDAAAAAQRHARYGGRRLRHEEDASSGGGRSEVAFRSPHRHKRALGTVVARWGRRLERDGGDVTVLLLRGCANV